MTFDRLGYVDWIDGPYRIAGRALSDVAMALGYSSTSHYNAACFDEPDDVRARLAAL